MKIIKINAHIRAQKQCLEKGYPKSEVTYDFQAYCTNLADSVTISVNKLEK